MEIKSINMELVSENFKYRAQQSGLFTNKFGSFAKSDFEILMFTAFLDSLEVPARDYDISIALGITESKVRNLRIKSQLLYPRDIDWISELSNAINHGHYDEKLRNVTITIENPSVQSMVKNIIEENFGIVGQSLNVKHLVLPVESFVILAATAEEDQEDVFNKLNKRLKVESENISIIEKRDFKTRFLSSVGDVSGFLSNTLTVFEKGASIIIALNSLIG